MMEENTEGVGIKHDHGKTQWGLLPVGPLEVVVRAAQVGVEKYGRDNWQYVENARERYSDAAERHFKAWQSGEMNDPESGVHHLGHAIFSQLVIIWFDLKDGQPASFWERRCHEMETRARCLTRDMVKLKRDLESARHELSVRISAGIVGRVAR